MVKKLCSILIAAMLTFAMFGCAKVFGGEEEEIDSEKTQLYINNFDGGYGTEWLRSAKARFEEANAEVSFEEGKKGVQILIEAAKVNGSQWLERLPSDRNQIIFTENIDYKDFVSQGAILDVTDIVTEKLTDYGEDRSIEDKMTDVQKAGLADANGKYYAIPHYEGYDGFAIDVDLFNNQKLFLGTDGKFKYNDSSDKLAYGPDGIKGTYDDGLPSTYDEFYELCREIKRHSCIPMTWSGQYPTYMRNVIGTMVGDSNGYNDTVISYTFNGIAHNVIDTINADGTYKVKDVEINNSNGYEMMNTAGYYNALRFMENIVRNGWYNAESFNSSYSHTDAQDKFLLSRIDGKSDPIAMIAEGCWWANEAGGTFKDMDDRYGNCGKKDRKFRFIPFPKATAEEVGTGMTIIESLRSYGFINANIKEQYIPLAKKFLQFVNTDYSLREFTVMTDTQKALDYELTAEDKEKMTYYGNSILELKNDPKTKVVYQLSTNPVYYNNFSALHYSSRLEVPNKYSYPATAFKNSDTLTAKSYFESLKSAWVTKWLTLNDVG